MDAHDKTGFVVHRQSVIIEACAVGGTNFDHARAGVGHDVRYTKIAANFYQLAARDYSLTVARQHR